ncbi:hypothetical protein ACEPAF_2827 [Sanghuangporus sanghuang]
MARYTSAAAYPAAVRALPKPGVTGFGGTVLERGWRRGTRIWSKGGQGDHKIGVEASPPVRMVGGGGGVDAVPRPPKVRRPLSRLYYG